jgi:tRNA-2-methylthio-N6-dimethylallyladenosine synthase
MADQVPKDVVQARYERLVALQEEISWAENKLQVGRTLDVLVAEGEGRKDHRTERLSGRAPDNRLVHFDPELRAVGGQERREAPRPGDVVTVEITYAAPHHLLAEGPALSVRRTAAGDAWERRHAAPAAKPAGVMLGLPTIGAPAPVSAAAAGACGCG